MKICIITSLYKPYSRGGAERVVENIVDGLIGGGNEVIVITTRPFQLKEKIPFNLPAQACPPLQKGELSVISFYPWNLFWFGNIDKKSVWLRFPWQIIDVFNLHSYFKIKKILEEEKPDLVMTHNLKGIGYTVPMAIRNIGIRHIHTSHDVQLVEPSGLIYEKKVGVQNVEPLRRGFQKVYTWINKKLFASPDVIISPSQWLMNFYTKKGFFKNSKQTIMNNPIQESLHIITEDMPAFCLRKQDAGKRGFSQDSNFFLKLLYIGQIEVHKGILFLIDVVKNLTNVHLDIVGTGTKLEEIQELAKENDNIKIHGYVENDLLNKFFVQNDFLIVPSLCYENSPTVIYESFVNGVPVIASSIGGIPELVKEGYNGYIFEAGNKQQLLDTLQECVNEKDKWDILRQNALKSVKGQGIDEYIKKLILKTNTQVMHEGRAKIKN